MSWKAVLLTKNNRPPQIVATIKDDMLKLQISPEIASLIGLRTNQPFSAFIGTATEQGQVKISASDGGGKVKGGTTSPTVFIPSESSWQSIDEPTKVDYEVLEEEKTLVVNLPWYTGQSTQISDMLHGNQKLTTKIAARMLEQYRRGSSRRRLAEYYGVSEATVSLYTNNPEDVRANMDAKSARKAVAEATALLGNAATTNGAAVPPVTVCPPRAASGLRKPARY